MTRTVKVELSCDFKMLSEQYHILLNIIKDLEENSKSQNDLERKDTENKVDNLYGLVHFVEAFQDRSSHILGDEAVFGKVE